jgi:hypothetical protein
VRRLVVLLVVALAVVLGRWPAPAGACSCLEQTVDQQAAVADVVLAGEVVDQEPSGETESFDAVRNRLAVERVYVGEAEAEVDVLAGETASGGCEYAFGEGRYLVFGTVDENGIHTSYCSGTRLLAADEAVPAALGAGAPPTALPPAEDDAFDLAPWPLRLVAAGVGIALAVGGATLWRRRRSAAV